MNDAAGALAEQYETAKAEYDTLLADKLRVSMRLSSLLRLRSDSVNEDQKQEMTELSEQLPALDKSIDLLSPVVTAAAAALRDSPSHGRGAPGGLAGLKGTLKFPNDLLKFEHDKTIIPEFFDHTETTLMTHNMPESQWVLALMHQCRGEPAAMKWVKTNIFNANLDWGQAKAKFTDKFEVVSAEERQLEILFRLDHRKCKSSNEHLERIRTICENTGIDHDQFWVVTLAMVTLNPRVVSLVKFAKQPKVKLTWDGLVEAVAAAEHRIVHDLTLPLTTPTKADVPRRQPQVKDKAALPVVPSGSGDAGPAKERRKEWLATATCHTCGQIGHISPNCPQKKPRREPAASGQRGPSGAFFVGAAAADDAAASVDVDQELADMLAIEPTFGLFMLAEVEDDGPADSSSPHALEESKDAEVPGSMEVPLMIGGKKAWAFVDTGSASSLYNLTFVEANTELFHTPDGASGPAFVEAFNGQTSPLGRPVVCRHLQFGSRVVSNLTCRTSPFPVGAQRCSLLIGRDQFASFGIGVSGLPVDFPSSPDSAPNGATGAAEQYEIDNVDVDGSSATAYTDTLWKAEDQIDATDRQQLLDAIDVDLRANEVIPNGSFCNHPSSVVKLKLKDPDQQPVYRPQYPVPKADEPFVDKQVDSWVADGITEDAPAGSDRGGWNSPLYPAHKNLPGGGKAVEPRVTADMRGVNEVIQDFEHNVPLILTLFMMLQGFLFASALDLKKSFHQFEVAAEDRHLLAFTWRNRRYMFRGAPFGVKTLTAVFQSVMDAIFVGMVFVVLFVDDIIVFTKTNLLDHIGHVKAVIKLLTRYNLRLNIRKCKFGYRRLRILGHILSGKERRPDPEKTAAVQNWPQPKTGKDIMCFLGFVNYLRDYIPLYAAIAAPLETLRKCKAIGSSWTEACAAAFATFKKVLAMSPVICFPDYAFQFLLAVDASQFGLGLVLFQVINGRRRYVLFASKSLNAAQRNYSATKRELLAIIFALQRCRNYVYGFSFQLWTDHKALTFLFTQRVCNYMMQAWLDVLLDFTFEVVHCPGVLNVLPDALSRCFRVIGLVAPVSVVSGEAAAGPFLRLQGFIQQRLGKTLPPTEQQQALVQSAHERGHFGAEYMFTYIWDLGYYWPQLRAACAKAAATCMECLKFNIGKSGFHPARSLHATEPFDACSIDTAGPYTTSPRGYNYFFVYTCLCTRFVLAIPLKTLFASEVAWELWKLFCTFPLPKSIQSDNGTQFVNKVLKALFGLMGVTQNLIAAYNPSANGVAERLVGLVKSVLSKIMGGNVANFDLYLPAAQLFINTKVSLLTKTCPMEYVFARSSNSFADYSRSEMRLLSEIELTQRAGQVRDVVFPELASAVQQRQQRARDRLDNSRRVVTRVFPPGSSVMVKDVTRSQKHQPYFTGPFTVLRRTKAGTYTLLTPDGTLFHRNVPVQQLKLIAAAGLADVSDLDSLSRTYLVERVVDHRGGEGQREYLVKWRGYEDRTWEPHTNFSGTADAAIREYWSTRDAAGVSPADSAPVDAPVAVPAPSAAAGPGLLPDDDAAAAAAAAASAVLTSAVPADAAATGVLTSAVPAEAAATSAVVAAAAPASAVSAPLPARSRAGRLPTTHAIPSKFR